MLKAYAVALVLSTTQPVADKTEDVVKAPTKSDGAEKAEIVRRPPPTKN